ncbi:AIPR family protein [Cytophagaceae bacterium YF14B1]|uniref:AIPR family protein n=1 Tax=Xanthocytophaga flava TaxID=3048013 RepID=A0AAE3UBB1_9BACT|nr:AIPR family protein [Xanthocytophaga flavus]MDJ1483589.1 AIPR family protein [Xanthocytophaga flavus]
MTLNELTSFFDTLIKNITSEDNNINRTALLDYVLPALNLARLTESEQIDYSYYRLDKENVEIDGYLVNESGERLQLFLSNLILPDSPDIQISRKDYYESLFSKVKNFVTKSVKKSLTEVQTGDPASVLINYLAGEEFKTNIDVIEVFLVANNISIEKRGQMSPRTFTFTDDELKVTFPAKSVQKSKVILIKYQLIDLNRIYNFEVAEGNAEPIIITFDPPLTAIRAVGDTSLFESYLAVIPARLLVDFYHTYSSRLLERNVRSFLQFKGVNKQLKETISEEPEKFIAYNNGLTITATASEIRQSDGISLIQTLTDFQIVNGGQTTASIYFSNKEGLDISKVNVTAKINVVSSESREDLDDLISNISKYSNSQTRVSVVDLNSRSPYLIKIKRLSDSITDPSGVKWFFERIRGEFNTLLRINPKQKSQIEKAYPKQKRLSTEQLAKYYVAWGTKPYLVRKGGEKVFKDFMEFVKKGPDEKTLEADQLGRSFYEDMIAKAILFKEFENLYGSGNKSIGQIRSTVVPYTLSILYRLTLVKKINYFNLGAIWVAQSLPEDLKKFAYELLQRVHELCKKYSKSDDVGEYAKKEDLWNDILQSEEYRLLEMSEQTITILNKYRLSESDFKKRYTYTNLFDFSLINDTCRIHSNGTAFYKALLSHFFNEFTTNEKRKLEELIQKVQIRHNFSEDVIEFEKQIVGQLQKQDPDWFLSQNTEAANLTEAITYISNIYNKNLTRIKEAFEAETKKAINKGAAEAKANGFKHIGKNLTENKEPLMADIYKVEEVLRMNRQK